MHFRSRFEWPTRIFDFCPFKLYFIDSFASENSVDEADLELYFEADYENFGRQISCELKPGGKDIKVTDANKEEYLE